MILNDKDVAFLRNTAVVLITTWLTTLFIAFDWGRDVGRDEPKVCARVPGQQVVSSTVDSCTYATAYGRATRTRRAM